MSKSEPHNAEDVQISENLNLIYFQPSKFPEDQECVSRKNVIFLPYHTMLKVVRIYMYLPHFLIYNQGIAI
jgi:hypothetical protein